MLQDPRSLLQLAEERRRSGRLKEAIAVCLEGLSRHPNLDAVRVTLGRAYLDAGQSAEARDALQEVFSRQPDHHLAGKLLAEARKRLGDLEGAAATCREILSHYPRDREVEALLSSVEPAPANALAAAAPPAPQPAATEGAADPSPDFLPEDVVSAGPGSSRPSGTTGTRTPEPDDALQTNTLADLYLKQGLVDRALEVYRGMLRLDPANAPLRRRIEEIERRGETSPATPAAVAASPQAPAAPVQSAPPGTGAIRPAGRPMSAGDTRRTAVARLERWLETIRSGSDKAGGAGVLR